MDEFIILVKSMRDQQKKFFHARSVGDQAEAALRLKESKSLERQVDHWIERHNDMKSQPELF